LLAGFEIAEGHPAKLVRVGQCGLLACEPDRLITDQT
jgi:hypothetical protein